MIQRCEKRMRGERRCTEDRVSLSNTALLYSPIGFLETLKNMFPRTKTNSPIMQSEVLMYPSSCDLLVLYVCRRIVGISVSSFITSKICDGN